MNKYSTAKGLVNVAFAAVYIVCIGAAVVLKGNPMTALPVIIGALSFVGHMTIHAAVDIAINTARQVEQNDEIERLLMEIVNNKSFEEAKK